MSQNRNLKGKLKIKKGISKPGKTESRGKFRQIHKRAKMKPFKIQKVTRIKTGLLSGLGKKNLKGTPRTFMQENITKDPEQEAGKAGQFQFSVQFRFSFEYSHRKTGTEALMKNQSENPGPKIWGLSLSCLGLDRNRKNMEIIYVLK